MDGSLVILCGTALSVAAIHTLLGPDHYVPFVAMSKAGGWSLRRTMVVTLICGLGHVLSSVVIGVIGIACGAAVWRLETIESLRGDLAGSLFLGFGLAYLVWGIRRGVRNRPHTHWHHHQDGTVHSHVHVHSGAHVHVHDGAGSRVSEIHRPSNLTPWVLFVIFFFGPCEPLIPLVFYPAAHGAWWHVAIVSAVFGVGTLVTMTVVVILGTVGLNRAGAAWRSSFRRWSRFDHALAGAVVFLCGAVMKMGH